MSSDDLREMQEHVGLVEALVEEAGWSVLWGRAEDQAEKRRARIIGGYCVDREQYIAEISFLQGIDYVRKLPGQMKEELAQKLAEVEEAQAEEEEEWQEASM